MIKRINNRNYKGPERRKPENANHRKQFCNEDVNDQSCSIHKIEDMNKRITHLEETYKDVPVELASLSGRFGVIIGLIVFLCGSTITGIIYSFNAVHNFHVTYTDDQKQMVGNVNDIKEEIVNELSNVHYELISIRGDIKLLESNRKKEH